MTNYHSQARHRAFSQLVAFLLTSEGAEASYVPRIRRRISDAFADEPPRPQPDVALPGFHILVTTSQPYERLGALLDSARAAAALAGEDSVPVVVSHRPRGASAYDALVTLDLRGFARLVEKAHDRPEVTS